MDDLIWYELMVAIPIAGYISIKTTIDIIREDEKKYVSPPKKEIIT